MRFVVFAEEGIQSGGLGEELSARLKDRKSDTLYTHCGVPSEFLSQATRSELIKICGLDAQSLADKVDLIQQDLRFSKVVDMVKNDKWKAHNI